MRASDVGRAFETARAGRNYNVWVQTDIDRFPALPPDMTAERPRANAHANELRERCPHKNKPHLTQREVNTRNDSLR